MIRIGLNEKQKKYEIEKYINENNIKNVIVFSSENMFMQLPNLEIPIRQIGYKEIIMYRTFYPLLEEIDKHYLIVANELMRDTNRNCLTYNCYAKYTNQTDHRMVFNFHPIINNRKDIMILIDFDNSQKNKGLGLNDIDLNKYDIRCLNKKYNLNIIKVPLPQKADKAYEIEKKRLFEQIGNKDPDTIPRNLHLWTGLYKSVFLQDEEAYVARNKRFKKPNIVTYKKVEAEKKYIIIDMPIKRLEMNDFLNITKQENLFYLSTGFSVDNVYIQAFNDWVEEVKSIYAETGVYVRKR